MITNLQEFDAVGLQLLDALRSRIDHDSQDQYREFIDVGEGGLFIDMLAGELEMDQVPVTPEERDAIRGLLGFFTVDVTSEDDARAYPRICSRDRVVAALNVVGEP